MKKNGLKRLIGAATIMLVAVFVSMGMAACSETDDSVEEFPDWQAKNETYWNNLYTATRQKIAAGDNSWKMFLTYSKQGQTTATGATTNYSPEDYIIVHVDETGGGTTSPIYTDSVAVHYQGRLIPSTTYTDGLIFDTSWNSSKLNETTARAAHFAVASKGDGFTTALQQMHIGDRWTVYMPYQLAYGATENNSVPAYSTLIFDIKLENFAPKGTPLGHK